MKEILKSLKVQTPWVMTQLISIPVITFGASMLEAILLSLLFGSIFELLYARRVDKTLDLKSITTYLSSISLNFLSLLAYLLLISTCIRIFPSKPSQAVALATILTCIYLSGLLVSRLCSFIVFLRERLSSNHSNV